MRVCAYVQTFMKPVWECHICFDMAEFTDGRGLMAVLKQDSSGRVRGILKLLRRFCNKCGTELTAQALSDFFCLFASSVQGFLSNLWSCIPKICRQSLSQNRNYTREHSGNLKLVFSLITETKYKRTEEHIMALTLILVFDNVSVNTKKCWHEREGITNGCNTRCFTFFLFCSWIPAYVDGEICLGSFKTSHWWHHKSHWERVRGSLWKP